MSIKLYTLPWLKSGSGELSKKKIEAKNIINLLSESLDTNQLLSLYEKIKKIDSIYLKKLSKIKLLILSNKTTNFISKALVATGIRHGLIFEIKEINYSQVNELIFKKKIANFNYILLMFDYEMFNLDQPKVSASYACDSLFAFTEKMQETYSANIIIATLACPNKKILGNYDYNLKNSLQCKIEEVNRKIKKKKHNAIVFDLGDLANLLGVSEWFDDRFSKFFQSPFSHKFVPIFSEYICKIILAHMGQSKKVLVIDLDNTIWGGIVGECGSKKIKIGMGNPLGEVYQEIQTYLKNLKKIGVVLAICSKNNFNNAIEPFRHNKDMILKENDISVFVANWNDKYKNIESISKQLNLPLSSFVFFDDSEFEREMVRNYLPEVTVCELPEDPTYFTEILSSARYFEANLLSKEDKNRTLAYRSEMRRKSYFKKFQNHNEYLASLKMELTFNPINSSNIERTTQLFNKTNQFNLTAKKISRLQLEEISKSNEYFSFVVRLKDKFGDSGIISSIILKKNKETCLLENWVMSCRVFGRNVEYIIFEVVKSFLIKKKIKDITGYFIQTKKNNYVKDLFSRLSFSNESNLKGKSQWILKDIKNRVKKKYPFETKLSL